MSQYQVKIIKVVSQEHRQTVMRSTVERVEALQLKQAEVMPAV